MAVSKVLGSLGPPLRRAAAWMAEAARQLQGEALSHNASSTGDVTPLRDVGDARLDALADARRAIQVHQMPSV